MIIRLLVPRVDAAWWYLHDIYTISTGYLHGSLALVTVIPANCAIIIMLLLFSRLATWINWDTHCRIWARNKFSLDGLFDK